MINPPNKYNSLTIRMQIASYYRQQEKNAIVDGGDPLRHYLYLVVENKVFNFSILTVILINTIFIGLHTSDYIVATSGIIYKLYIIIYAYYAALNAAIVL